MSMYGLALGTLPGILKDAHRLQGDITLTRIVSAGKVSDMAIDELMDAEDTMGRVIRILEALRVRAVNDKPVERERSWVAQDGGLAEVAPDSAIPGWSDTPDIEYGDVEF